MKYLVPFIFCLILWSCGAEEETLPPDPEWSDDQSIQMNTVFSQEEEAEIDNFLSHRPDWDMTRSETGLRYFIYHKSGSVDTAHVGDDVTVSFEISLLDGTLCYSSEENGNETFKVEKTDIESGLHEAVKYMCVGDRGMFILPSHMAHGLIGDTEKIPPLSPVIYDLRMVMIKHNHE